MTKAEQHYAIGIDCKPGEPRPNAVFPGVLKGTGLRVSDFELQFKFFGAWLWHLKPDADKERLFLTNRAVLSRRLEKLLKTKVIRGAVLEPEGPCLIVDNERRRA